MKRCLLKSLLIIGALVGVGVCGGLFLCWQYRIWSWDDWESYKCMRDECHPVWRDLQAGRIKAGDKVDGVIWRTHPNHVDEFEDVKVLTYGGGFTSVTIVSKNGTAVQAEARSCTWKRPFFGNLDGQEWVAFDRRWSAHLDAKRKDKQFNEFIFEGQRPIVLIVP